MSGKGWGSVEPFSLAPFLPPFMAPEAPGGAWSLSALGGGGRKSRVRLDGAPLRLMVSSEEVEMKVCPQTSVWAPPLQRPAAVWEGLYPEGTVGCGEEQQAGAWH